MTKRFKRMATLAAALIIAAGLASTLSACGKKGSLEPPPEKEEAEK